MQRSAHGGERLGRLQPQQLDVQLADRAEHCRRQAPEYFYIGDCDGDDRWEVAGSSDCRGDAAAKQRTLAAKVWECQQAEARLEAARSARTETAAVTIQAGVRGSLCRRALTGCKVSMPATVQSGECSEHSSLSKRDRRKARRHQARMREQ